MEQNTYLAHFGIKGQKWGVRRYQNENGSLTPEGEKRYSKDVAKYRSLAKRQDLAKARHAKAQAKETDAEFKRDKIRSRWFQTDISQARANYYDHKRARAHIQSLRYESQWRNLGVKQTELANVMVKRYGEQNVKDL